MGDVHDDTGNNLEAWRAHGEWLACAAQVLRDQRAIEKLAWAVLWVELMLWGDACEAFLKALRLKRKKLLFQNGRFAWLTNHDLCRMARETQCPLTAPQQETLARLTSVVRWAGRYPVQLKGPGLEAVQWEDPRDYRVLEALLTYLRAELQS